MSDFKTRIKELREGNGKKALSHSQLASLFDKSEGAVRAWESGRNKPDADTLVCIAKYFNVSVDYLLGNSEYKKPENKSIIGELGLGEDSINIIMAKINEKSSDIDSLPLIDVFNLVLSVNGGKPFIELLNHIRNAYYYKDMIASKDSRAAKEYYLAGCKQKAHDAIDAIIDGIIEQAEKV